MIAYAFTKTFQPTPAEEAFAKIKQLGFDGLDLTVRKGGYVDPASESFEDDLAACAETWQKVGIAPGMFTTNIVDPSSPRAEDIIAAAGRYGVKYIKLGYKILKFGSLRKQLDEWRKGVLDLVPIAEQHGVTLTLHVHCANFAGAVPFHWIPIFEQTNSDALGMYLDPCHMHIEGAVQGWLMALEMARDVAKLVAVKDYRWFEPYKVPQEGYIYPIFTRLEKGCTPWNQVVYALKQIGYDGPFSIHGEYSDVDRHDVPSAIKKDLDYFKGLWEAPVEQLRLNKEGHIFTED